MTQAWIDHLVEAFASLAGDQELAYHCLTAKPEAAVRDKLSYRLQSAMKDHFVGRECTLKNKEAGKRLDIGIYDLATKKLVLAVEIKVLLVRDLFWGLKNWEKRQELHSTFADIRNDILGARRAVGDDLPTLGILFFWQVYTQDTETDRLKELRGLVKYAKEHLYSVKQGEHLKYEAELNRALGIAGLKKLADSPLEFKGPHGLSVHLRMVILEDSEPATA